MWARNYVRWALSLNIYLLLISISPQGGARTLAVKGAEAHGPRTPWTLHRTLGTPFNVFRCSFRRRIRWVQFPWCPPRRQIVHADAMCAAQCEGAAHAVWHVVAAQSGATARRSAVFERSGATATGISLAVVHGGRAKPSLCHRVLLACCRRSCCVSWKRWDGSPAIIRHIPVLW